MPGTPAPPRVRSKELQKLSDTIDSSTPASDAGSLDAPDCRPVPGEVPAGEQAAHWCRLSEALYYRGKRDEAVAYARAAFELEPRQPSTADFCAWLFSNCERHREAAAAYEILIESRPGWAAGHRHASGSCAVAGHIDRAIFHAAQACEIEPGSFEFAVHAGGLCATAGRHREAIFHLSRAAGIVPDDAGVLRGLSAAAFALDETAQAVELALRAYALAPGERANAIHAAELLLRSQRCDEAIEIVANAIALDACDDTVFRLLSAAQMLRGRPQEALEAIDRALALAPEKAEYHLHPGNLLYRLGHFEEAAAAFERATRLDPANPAARRSQLTAYFDSGRFREALAVGGAIGSFRLRARSSEAALLLAARATSSIFSSACLIEENSSCRGRSLEPPG